MTTFSHSASASILDMAWLGSTIVNITAGENLFVIVFNIGIDSFPYNSYLFFL